MRVTWSKGKVKEVEYCSKRSSIKAIEERGGRWEGQAEIAGRCAR